MYYSSLRKTLVGTTLSFAAAVALSSVSLGQGFSPSLPPANSTFGSGSKPVHSLPRTTPKLEQPNLGGGSSSKPKTNFGGSSYALPRPTKSQSSSASSFDTRPTTKPSVKLAPSDSFGNLGDDDVETSSSLSDIGSTSSGSGRELFIEICNVKLMQDIMIPAEEEGLLSELNVKEGDAVPTGKIIGKIDAGRMELAAEEARLKLDIQNDKASSKSALNVAYKKYKLAREEYESAARLARKGSKSSHEVNRAKYSMEASRAEVQDAIDQRREAAGLARLEEMNLKQIMFIIKKMEVSTPFDGHVMEILKHPMEYVQKGEDIIRFARMDKLWVEGIVSSKVCKPTDVKGQRVTVTLRQAGDEEVEFAGRVIAGPMELEGVGKRFRVRAEVDNRFENGEWILLPGASLSMSVELGPDTARRNSTAVNR